MDPHGTTADLQFRASSGGTPVILITTLAEYQTAFWAAVGHELRLRSRRVAFLSFDDRSTDMLRNMGFETWCFEHSDAAGDLSDAALSAVLDRFGIKDFPYWSSHERFTFGVRDAELRRKFLEHLSVAERACSAVTAGGCRAVMVQELGGFLSVIASYYAARRAGVDNWFIEPAFFRGKLFFLKNSFAAHKVTQPAADAVSPEVVKYVAETLATGAIVVPKKDRHQYTAALWKVLNGRNLRRLFRKLFDKYALGKRQEFGYIGRHVAAHARMLVNSLRLRRHYSPLLAQGPIVYYPMHVPGDMALTLRSPQYLDQLALIELLLRSVPHTHRVAVKEHPAMIGAIDPGRLIELKRRHDNLVLLPPSTNNYDVIRSAELVVSVNSKSGAEAALLGKPVLVLGDAFYRHSPLVCAIDDISQLRSSIGRALSGPAGSVDEDLIYRYFEAVWRDCHPGELYVSDEANVSLFSQSLLSAVSA
jgi:hypothetical protein